MNVELKQLIELFKGNVFKFNFMSEGMMDFVSTIPIDIGGNYYIFKLDFFYNEDGFFADYNTFEELIDMHKLFEVYQYPLEDQKNKEIIYPKNFIDPTLN